MYDDQLKNALQTAVNHRLSGLNGNPFLAQRIMQSEKGEPKMKKASTSLVLVLALMILTLSVGFALVRSGIIEHLYGSEENVPQAIVEQIQRPEATATTALGKLSVDELLYDGTSLHTTVTVENPTGEALLYTLDGLSLNGEKIMGSNILLDGAGYGGMLLGGEIAGTQLPASYTFYNKGELLLHYDESGKFMGYENFPEGDMTLTIDLAVWRPINTPEMIDYRLYEGYNVTETRQSLTADAEGLCNLELFRPAAYYRTTTGKDVSSDVYADVYKELGWAQKIDTVTLTLPVTLDKTSVPHATPTQTEYEINGVQLVFEQFDFTQAGGQAEGLIYGETNVVRNLLRNGLTMMDTVTDRVFTGGLIWDSDIKDGEGVRFTLLFTPFTGDMPEAVQLLPVIQVNDDWTLDFDSAVIMELTHNE